MSVLFTRRGMPPNWGPSGGTDDGGGSTISGTLLSDLTEGSIVYIPENGTNVEFYVAKHDYESGLNGDGRTLLVRKDCYDKRVWSSSHVVYYQTEIDTWLNNDYLSKLDSKVREVVDTTTFTVQAGTQNTTQSRAVFLLSLQEYGFTDGFGSSEGSTLSISSTLRIAYYNGTATNHWTRTRHTGTSAAFCISSSGSKTYPDVDTTQGSRPCFTLPSTTLFDPSTKEFVGVGGNSGGSDEPALITFTASGTTYQAEQGMTWAEWCDSTYNIDDFYVEEDTGYVCCDYYGVWLDRDYVVGSDLIISSASYDIG